MEIGRIPEPLCPRLRSGAAHPILRNPGVPVGMEHGPAPGALTRLARARHPLPQTAWERGSTARAPSSSAIVPGRELPPVSPDSVICHPERSAAPNRARAPGLARSEGSTRPATGSARPDRSLGSVGLSHTGSAKPPCINRFRDNRSHAEARKRGENSGENHPPRSSLAVLFSASPRLCVRIAVGPCIRRLGKWYHPSTSILRVDPTTAKRLPPNHVGRLLYSPQRWSPGRSSESSPSAGLKQTL
jgi:hypothetical protein